VELFLAVTKYLSVQVCCLLPVPLRFEVVVTFQRDFSLQRHSLLIYSDDGGRKAMDQAVSRRPVTTEARVRFQDSPCGNCDGQIGTVTS
jgi:hypothetical protein